MDFLYQPWPYLATSTVVAGMGVYAWRQPHRPGTKYFELIIFVWLAWALAAAFSTIIPSSISLHYGLWGFMSLCAWLTSPLAVIFALAYTGNEKWLTRSSLGLLFLPALLFILSVVILPADALVYIEMRPDYPVIVPHDIVKLITLVVNIVIWLINFYILIGAILRAPVFRAPVLWILLGQVFPAFAYVFLLSQSGYLPVDRVVILLFNTTAVTYFVALYYFQILQINPVARDIAINQIPHAMIVLDNNNRLVDFNLAAQTLPKLPGKLKIGQPALRALPDWWDLISTMIGPTTTSNDLVLFVNNRQVQYNVQSIPIFQPSGWRMGQVLLIRDVTQERRAQQQQEQTLWVEATFLEREQLANELHDGLSQDLAFLNLQAQTAQLYLENGENEAAQSSIARLIRAAEEIDEDIRQLIGILLSSELPAEDFGEALRQLVSIFKHQTGLSVDLHINEGGVSDRFQPAFPEENRLPPVVVSQLIRIAQEALTNVRKHARGTSKISVEFKVNDGAALLVITDDGRGFDFSAVQGGEQHFGLQIMRQRAERIGGQTSIFSMPGKGTQIQVSVPLIERKTGVTNANPYR